MEREINIKLLLFSLLWDFSTSKRRKTMDITVTTNLLKQMKNSKESLRE